MPNTLLCFHDHLEKFRNYLNSKHRNIDSPMRKHNNHMPFLDVLITRTNNSFKTSAHQKPAFSKIFKFQQFHFHFIISKVFNCFGFFKFLFRSVSFKINFKKECFSFQIVRKQHQKLSQSKTHWETSHINCWEKGFNYSFTISW